MAEGKGVSNVTRDRVRYSDTDSFGVVYFANYYRWAEAARTEIVRKYTGKTPKDFEREGYAFPFVSSKANYFHPARVDDPLEIETHVVSVGNTSITLAFRIKNEETEELLCEIELVSVMLKRNTEGIFEKSRIPDSLKNKLFLE